MARPRAATAVRHLAGLLAVAVLLTATPPLLQAAVATPAGEEADGDVEPVSPACPRRVTGPGGPPGEPGPVARVVVASVTPVRRRSPRRSPSAPFAPHPRC